MGRVEEGRGVDVPLHLEEGGRSGGAEAMSVDRGDARVLVVDDDSDNRTVISRLLRLSGVPPERFSAVEGDAARFLSSSGERFDLVFLDLHLPKKDGYAVLAEIRADPRLAGTRVVALTASVTRSEIQRCREAGFDGFIGKPIDGRRFSELLSRILAGGSVWTED